MAKTATKKPVYSKRFPKVKPRKEVYERAQLDGRVYIHNEERLFIAPLNNLSASGMFLDGVTHIAEGDEVRIVIKSPKLSISIQAVGEVVRVEKSNRTGIAIQFTHITMDAQSNIHSGVQNVNESKVMEVV